MDNKIKYFLVLLLGYFYARIFAVPGGSKNEVMRVLGQCIGNFSLTTDEMNAFAENYTVPYSDNGKRFIACMLKRAKFYPNNKFNRTSGMKDFEELFKGEDDRLALATYAVETCSAVVGTPVPGTVEDHAYAIAICGATFAKLYLFKL